MHGVNTFFFVVTRDNNTDLLHKTPLYNCFKISPIMETIGENHEWNLSCSAKNNTIIAYTIGIVCIDTVTLSKLFIIGLNCLYIKYNNTAKNDMCIAPNHLPQSTIINVTSPTKGTNIKDIVIIFSWNIIEFW